MKRKLRLPFLILGLLLTSCGGGPDNNKGTSLNIDNYTDYVSVSAKFYGEEGYYSGGYWYYQVVTGEATVKSETSNYDFIDAGVEFTINGTYSVNSKTQNFSEKVYVKMNIGGNGTNKVSVRVSSSKNINTTAYFVTGIGYTVTKVEGKIIRP